MAVAFSTTQDKIESLYVGYFSRAADPAGLNYWMSQIDSGANSLAQVAASFSVQPEATARYPYLANPGTGDSGAFIDQVYQSLFNHAADAAGKAYWQAELDAASNNPAAIGAFILNVISGAQGSDAVAVTNKVAVASYFTNSLVAGNQPYNSAADAEGRTEVTNTDSTTASVTANEARADVYGSTGSPPPPVDPVATFTLTPATSSVDEGQHDLVTVTTTNVPAGTVLAYTISGIAASRVDGGLTGSVTVDSSGHAVIDLSLIANGATDGASTAMITLNNGMASTNVTVNDTSTTPVQTGPNFTLTTAVDNLAGGGGTNTFAGTFSDGGSNTFNLGDTLAGDGGTDTLNVTPSILAAATSLVDGLWTNVSGIENVSVTTGPGVISMTTGAAFQAAFATGGVNLAATTTDGAINIDMSTFTGAQTLTTSSGAGAETITTGAGVGTVTANTTAGALTISGAGLAGVSATTTGAGAQTIGDLVGGGASLVSVNATGGSGTQIIHSTSTSAVSVNATTAGGPQTITTGSGNDTIVLGSSASSGSINGGAGADAITLGATHSGVDQITAILGQSTQTAFDTVRNFSMAVSDELALGTTTLLNSAQLGGGFTVTSGMATDAGATLADFLLAATTSMTAGVVAFTDGADTYVVASDGIASGAQDTVVELIGVNNATAVGGAAAATMIHIV
jgi:hypothetical protein